jgi:hypothetical protein
MARTSGQGFNIQVKQEDGVSPDLLHCAFDLRS